MTSKGDYYYAEGWRVPLERDHDRVAIDLKGKIPAKLQAEVAKLRSSAQMLPGSVALCDREALTPALLGALEAAGVLQPVFTNASTTMVALPEVRVELEDKGRKPFMSALAKLGLEAEITSDEGTTFSMRPASGSGEDALTIANKLHEAVAPPMVQARFVRIQPRPRG